MPQIGRHFMPNMQRAAWGFMQSGDFPVPVLHLKFGENTGTEAKDSSPEGNDGDIDGATWVKGYLGPGLSFDGLDDVIDCGSDSSLLPDACTVIVAVKTTEVAELPLIGWAAGSRPSLRINTASNRPLLYMGTSNSRYFNHSPVNLADGIYHVVAIILTGNDMDDIEDSAMYVDGRPLTVNTTTSTGPATAKAHCYIGKSSTSFIKSVIDEILMFDEALSAAQIRELSLGYR